MSKSNQLLAHVVAEPNPYDIGPQALWNELCLRLSPMKRVIVPGGLLCGLREKHLLDELVRLYQKIDPTAYERVQVRSPPHKIRMQHTEYSDQDDIFPTLFFLHAVVEDSNPTGF